MIHSEPHPLAGQTVALNSTFKHPQFPNAKTLRLEDWQDRVFGKSWMACDGNPACMVYGLRSGFNGLPLDNEVVYGKFEDGRGGIVHVSELDVPAKAQQDPSVPGGVE